ncbi:MAG: IS3 family transposase [Alphaproteobacteria bacterium]
MKPGVSERRVCQVLAVSRSVARVGSEERERRRPPVDELLAARLQRLIEEHPTYGYRRLWALLWALLRHRDGVVVNRKAVYRVLVRKRWLVTQ